jgi:hypothetical protein
MKFKYCLDIDIGLARKSCRKKPLKCSYGSKFINANSKFLKSAVSLPMAQKELLIRLLIKSINSTLRSHHTLLVLGREP